MDLRQPPLRATRTGASHEPIRGTSAAGSSAPATTSKRSAKKGGSAQGKKSTKKRGRRTSATRANLYREAQAKTLAAVGLDRKDGIEVA